MRPSAQRAVALNCVTVQLLRFLAHLRRISFQSRPAPCLLRLIQFPPPPLKGGITVTAEDLQCLDGGKYLNDVIIDFYLKWVRGARGERPASGEENQLWMFLVAPAPPLAGTSCTKPPQPWPSARTSSAASSTSSWREGTTPAKATPRTRKWWLCKTLIITFLSPK